MADIPTDHWTVEVWGGGQKLSEGGPYTDERFINHMRSLARDQRSIGYKLVIKKYQVRHISTEEVHTGEQQDRKTQSS